MIILTKDSFVQNITECEQWGTSLISDFRRDLNIVYFLLGISPASNCSWPKFRNPVSVPSSKAGCTGVLYGSETSANYNLTPGKYPEENIQSGVHVLFLL